MDQQCYMPAVYWVVKSDSGCYLTLFRIDERMSFIHDIEQTVWDVKRTRALRFRTREAAEREVANWPYAGAHVVRVRRKS